MALGNEFLRLDFDRRTSDTMYNYIWVRRPGGEWLRAHNFGVDVRAVHADGRTLNCIGMDLDIEVEGRRARVRYPSPLVQYRQFDDKVGAADVIARYPGQERDELRTLVHADGEAEFVYELDAGRPAYTVSGRILSGRVGDVTFIVSALWTDNRELPTHMCLEGFPEIDQASAFAAWFRHVETEGVAYALFYRPDGRGVPFALLPLDPGQAAFCNFFDNRQCLRDFRAASLNQSFVPAQPAVHGANDTGYIAAPRADGILPAVRVVFFPELGWGAGGTGDMLRERLRQALRDGFLDAARAWHRKRRGIATRLTIHALLLDTEE